MSEEPTPMPDQFVSASRDLLTMSDGIAERLEEALRTEDADARAAAVDQIDDALEQFTGATREARRTLMAAVDHYEAEGFQRVVCQHGQGHAGWAVATVRGTIICRPTTSGWRANHTDNGNVATALLARHALAEAGGLLMAEAREAETELLGSARRWADRLRQLLGSGGRCRNADCSQYDLLGNEAECRECGEATVVATGAVLFADAVEFVEALS